jgi:hypothetical protein
MDVAMRPALIFCCGLGLRLVLIAQFPLIFGGDPMVRMIQRDRILISHQLPLLQLIVFSIARVTHNYLITMIVMTLIGASVGVAFYMLARDVVQETPAVLAALMIATNPFLAGYSIVPFQESLMVALLLLAFHFQYVGKPWAASLCLGLACLTRYEAWAAVPVFVAVFVWRRGFSAANILRAVAIFGWAPLGWIVFQRGLAPAGSYVLESHITAARVMRWVYLGYISVKFTPLIVIGLGLFGLWIFWRDHYGKAHWPLVAFIGLFGIALLFSAHGDLPDPERRIASREATLWIASLSLLAAIALDKLPRYRTVLAALGVVFGVWGSYRFARQEAADPHLVLSYRLAKFFDRALQPGERALILAPPWPREVFDFYLQRARETGGQAGYEAAVRSLLEADMSPPSYQRMLIHSKLDRSRFLSTPGPCTEWMAVWSDYGPARDLPSPQAILEDGSLSVRIGRQTCSR